MTTHLKDTHTLRAVTIPDACFDNYQVDRIIHVMECGREVLLKDVETFAAAAKKIRDSDRGFHEGEAQAMSSMQQQFQRYVDEATDLIERLRGLNYDGVLAFVDFDGHTGGLIEALNEILHEEGLRNG